jgi:hypothetical protein
MAAQPVQSPARALVDGALGSLGKVVAAAAGAGVFLFLIGAAVLWRRVEDIGLQAQEIVSAIPRDQLAVAGARDALLSVVAGIVFGFFLHACYRVFRASQQVERSDGVGGRLARWMRERPAVVVTVVVAFGTWPFIPFDWGSALFHTLFLVNLFLGARSAHRSLTGEARDFRTSLVPWLRVALGLSIAVFLVSVWRPSEFTDRFPIATVTLEQVAGAAKAAEPVCGLYLGSTSDAVILAATAPPPGAKQETKPSKTCPPSRQTTGAAIIVARDKIAQIALTRQQLLRPSPSLLRRLGVAPLECVAPVCQWKRKRFSALKPFGGGEETVASD